MKPTTSGQRPSLAGSRRSSLSVNLPSSQGGDKEEITSPRGLSRRIRAVMDILEPTLEGNNIVMPLGTLVSPILYFDVLIRTFLFLESNQEAAETIAPVINVGCHTASMVKTASIGSMTLA